MKFNSQARRRGRPSISNKRGQLKCHNNDGGESGASVLKESIQTTPLLSGTWLKFQKAEGVTDTGVGCEGQKARGFSKHLGLGSLDWLHYSFSL